MLGATGLLGKSFVEFYNPNFDVVTHGFSDFADYCIDLRDARSVRSMILEVNPSVILNLVAMTDVDNCETHPTLAYEINVKTVECLVETLIELNSKAHLIYISTDHVYDGFQNEETDVSLVNYYAYSKYCAELLVSRVPSTILRTNFFGRSLGNKKPSFTDWVYERLVSGDYISGFEDVFFSPIHMRTLIDNIHHVADIKPVGLYNVGASTGISKYDFIRIFSKQLGFPTDKIRPVQLSSIENFKAKRPRNMIMDVRKYESLIKTSMPGVAEEIYKAVRECA